MLQKHGHYNDLSTELRKELTDKILTFGKKVRYKFNISHENPDPTKYNGPTVWPGLYVLDPCTFRITDPHEKRDTVSRAKEIGLIDKLDKDGKPERFFKIKVYSRHQGVLTFDLTEPADLDMVMYLELHPKLKDGKFALKDGQKLVERIDESKEAKTQRQLRSAKSKALRVAEEMSEDDVRKFADAMLWDSTEEMDLLQNRVEALAESTPDFFNDLVAGKNIEYQATIKRALDKGVIAFDPGEFKYIYSSNQQTIVVLQPVGTKNHVEKFAEWLMTGGQKSEEVYKRLKNIIK